MTGKRSAIRTGSLVTVLAALALAPVASASHLQRDFFADLAGENEVPPRVTDASGLATFQLNDDGTEVSFQLFVEDITNVVGAHIHVGERGVNGPIVVFLFGTAPPAGGPSSGLLSQGTFTEEDFIGPLAGAPLSDLLARMANGTAYVNVHTDDGVAPTDTGPGDHPGGEIRNQVSEATGPRPPCAEDVTAEALQDGSIELRWRIPDGTDAGDVVTRIYRSVDGGPLELAFVASARTAEQNLADAEVEPGQTARYELRLFDGERESTGCPGATATAVPEFPTLAIAGAALAGALGTYTMLRRKR